jgi:hypothetical protein
VGSENAYMTWQRERLALQCAENLKKHQFDAHFVPDVESARDLVFSMISDYATFGFGGSDTLRSLGIPETLKAEGKTIYDHWEPGLTREAEMEIRLQQGRCDCFLCSANAVSVTGEIVNVDGVGNRTNAMCFGAGKVILVVGANKISLDLESALSRVREVAGPMRAKSLGMDTPCAETGICSDCNAPQRICRITTILHRKPMLTDVSVILVNTTLGY